ncbi:MAG TPA: response regulator [Terricaulis sp.]|nr:response regulator [Terricaulis sp.]
MDVKAWIVCVIEPNKFERQIIFDLLRQAGVERVRVMEHADEALEVLEAYRANVIISSFEIEGSDAAAWTRVFRRSKDVANRKAAVFVTSAAFSRTMAEQCRHAGANALIGKPLSAKVLLATINKVLTQPREFIDAAGYVGPCRRAGIVTAGEPRKRRKVDGAAAGAKPAMPALTLEQAVAALAAAAQEFAADPKQMKTCEAALRFVQAYAVNASDGPLRGVCAAFAQQLGAQNVPNDTRRMAVEVCVEGVARLAAEQLKPAEREAIARRTQAAVSKAIAPRAA